MENIWYDLGISIFSAILGAISGVIFSKLFDRKKDSGNIQVDQQLIFAQIHIEQNKYIFHETAITNRRANSLPAGSGMSAGEILVIYGLGSLFLIYGFLKYESQISNMVMFATIFLESAFITTAYMITKHNYIDKSIRSILGFNIIATLCAPILLYLMKSPFLTLPFDKANILNQMDNEGFISLLKDTSAYGFLLYQAVGIIILFGFLLFTLMGIIHILSMLNLALERRPMAIWRWTYRKTVNVCSSGKFYIGFGVLLLVLSFLFVSGILINIIM